MKNKVNSSSNLQVYHNLRFPLEHIVDVLYPLFGQFYRYDDFIRMIMNAHHIFCVYDRIQQRCVGCALVNNADKTRGLYLMLFGVHQSNQHHGVGTYLLKKIIQWARYTRHSYIYLHVNVDNYKAIGLYEKVGFRKHERIPDYYNSTPKRNPDAYQMVMSLR